METRASDPPSRGGTTAESLPRAGEADDKVPWLPDLIRQQEAFANDVMRIEAELAEGAEGSPGLYERLLRCRRISGKLENRIEIVRIQQKRQASR